MTYYPDLSSFTYTNDDPENTVNIGWLDKKHKFPRGKVSDEFLIKLWAFSQIAVHQTRGFHYCPFCHQFRFFPLCIQRGAEALELGSAQIRVFGNNGLIYAAPDLLYHYIVKHRYQPPREFIQAVLEEPQPETAKYEDLLLRYDLPVDDNLYICKKRIYEDYGPSLWQRISYLLKPIDLETIGKEAERLKTKQENECKKISRMK